MLKEACNIGVLDIMGSVEEHETALQKCGISTYSIKMPEDLEQVQGLIIPGGESTTIGKLMKMYGLDKAIQKRVAEKSLAVWGTCAGAILLAKKVLGKNPNNLELLDITIERNAYGSQIESFETTLDVTLDQKTKKLPAVFIRAPRITAIGKNIEILALHKNDPVLVREGSLLASTFHPEMTNDFTIHKYFIEMVKKIV